MEHAADFTRLQPLSLAARFFHAYPRLSNASTHFALSHPYRDAVYRLGVPYFVAGALVMLVLLVVNIYAYVRRGVVPGADDSIDAHPDRRDAVAKRFLLFSAFLNIAILTLIALAFAAAFAMRKSTLNAHDALHATAVNISLQLYRPVAFVDDIANQASDFGAPPDSDTADSITLLHSHSAGFSEVMNATDALFGHFGDIGHDLDKISNRFFTFTVVVLTLTLVAMLLSIFADASDPHAAHTRIAVLLVLLLALGACWSLTAVTTWIGVASGDFCHSLSIFHQVVDGQQSHGHVYAASVYQNNFFLSNDMQCPRFSSASASLRRFNIFLGSARISDWFLSGVGTITERSIPLEQWRQTFLWMQETLAVYVECGVQQRFGGHLTTHICSTSGVGAVSAIFQIWLYSIALSLLVTLVVVLLTLGQPPSEFCTARELLYIYGAPKLISAFGDIGGVLSKHSTFRNLESKKLSFLDAAGTISDSEDSQATRFGDQDSISENDNSITTQRSRRNAYVSHRLQTPVNRHTVWYSDSDDANTTSDGLP